MSETPIGWTKGVLGDSAVVTRGASPRPINDWIVESGTPWVKISDATSTDSRVIRATKEFIRNEGRHMSVVVYPGDLIVSNSATPGIPRFMGIEGCIHDGWLLLREIRGLDHHYLYYVILNDRKRLVEQGNGSIFTNLKTEVLKRHQILIPPRDEQRAISEILGALDDKIEANRKLAAIADELTTALYRWVVRDAVDEVRLGDLLTLQYGKALPATRRGEGEVPVFGSGGVVGTHDVPLVAGPGIIVGRKGSVGTVYWSEVAYFPIDTVYYVVPQDGIPQSFIYYAIKAQRFGERSTDSAVPGLNRNDAYSSTVRLPSRVELARFDEQASSLFKLDYAVANETTRLANLRDTLLPKLLSGQLRVREAERLVANAV